MKYITFDEKQFKTRREARDYLKSIGEGKDMKLKIRPIPENSNDYASFKRKYAINEEALK